ncbi:MAG: transcription termination/antitermination NusG family protein, partial [Tannerella sp.]
MTEEELRRIRAARTLNWYVLYTAPRAEKKVEERLRERGVAHAAFRDHLESGTTSSNWAYLIPP